jgi:hypothetical protein
METRNYGKNLSPTLRLYDKDRMENEKNREGHIDAQTARWYHKPLNKK